MIRKNLFVSVALTSFLLIILTGVVAASQLGPNVLEASQPTGISAQASVVQSTENSSQVAFQNTGPTVSAQEAAQIAAEFLGHTDLYSVENSIWSGQTVYKVVFSSGYVVYVGLDGRLLAIEAPQLSTQNSFRFGGQPEHEEHEGNEGPDDD